MNLTNNTLTIINVFKKFHLPIPNWHKYSGEFISFINSIGVFYLYLLVGIFLIFFLHYLTVGPKKFTEGGKKIFFYGFLARFFHWICAFFFSLLVITGLMIIFAKSFGGSEIIRLARSIHLYCAYGFILFVIPLFLIWVKDMFPASYDIQWIFMFGGYLSKEERPVPAGKFNFGQKIWFWLSTIGGAVMFYTGYFLQRFSANQEQLVFYLKIHLILALFIVAFFITHLYMSLFAVKGSLKSMLTGFKSQKEVSFLHSKMHFDL